MARTRLIAALILTYVAFAMLLNSVGTVILQSISSFGVSKPEASTLEGFKDKSAAGMVDSSPHAFVRPSWGSPVFWALRGFAVLATGNRLSADAGQGSVHAG